MINETSFLSVFTEIPINVYHVHFFTELEYKVGRYLPLKLNVPIPRWESYG